MDLSKSKIPELELRWKIKPLYDRIVALEAEIDAAGLNMRRQLEVSTKTLCDERDKLDEEIGEILGDGRAVQSVCCLTGLPIFDGDEVVEALAAAETGAAA
jgi:hypothetical protein